MPGPCDYTTAIELLRKARSARRLLECDKTSLPSQPLLHEERVLVAKVRGILDRLDHE